MKTDDFNFHLPESLIAQQPAKERTDSRMMVLHRATGTIEHRRISDIGEYFNPNDVLVTNNTRVIPARISGTKKESGGKVEILLLEETDTNTWLCLLKTSRRPKPGMLLEFCDGQLTATFLSDGEQGRCTLRFESERPLLELLDQFGVPPLPPYIERKNQTDAQLAFDKERYQTVFAQEPGAVAAPTAGLHFSEGLLAQLKNEGVDHALLTLHVGIGTFRPVTADTITDHKMDEERYLITEEAAQQIQRAKAAGGKLVAVGSTSVRTLETVASHNDTICHAEGRTDIFIYPPYEFKAVDAILTNFHLPKSTLIMMMSAFAGRELMMTAYAEAIEKEYRFYSYGDCMLIL